MLLALAPKALDYGEKPCAANDRRWNVAAVTAAITAATTAGVITAVVPTLGTSAGERREFVDCAIHCEKLLQSGILYIKKCYIKLLAMKSIALPNRNWDIRR
eukprot:TRINITY_DN16890_c1_g1_i1.p1 TRINITY_DN16890_c1_g1~~TRINITY_DN16890_c1_g1_i1.p1  ORF type:complete len:102 (-),score=12.09 TRINITY_DN16890_c1_g1_i1:17-322(-)